MAGLDDAFAANIAGKDYRIPGAFVFNQPSDDSVVVFSFAGERYLDDPAYRVEVEADAVVWLTAQVAQHGRARPTED